MTAVQRLVLLTLSLLLSVAAPAVHAQNYALEIIVFANPGGDARAAETWRADPGLPDVTRAQPAGISVTPLGPNAYRMSGIWQALRASPGYRPLRHMAWLQRGTSRARAPVVLLGEGPDSEIYGTVRLSRGRFLHVDLDLVLQDADGPVRFKTSRKMRSDEIHYLDHPLFGVMVVATPR